MAAKGHRINPWIPKPERKEKPVVEELVHDAHKPHIVHPLEHPAILLKPDFPVQRPNFNTLYDEMRSTQAWRYLGNAYANGTITTIAGTQVLVTVNLTLPANTQSPNWRLEQWPGGVQLFLFIRKFSTGPQTASFASQGEIDVLFISQAGQAIPLGVIPNNNFTNDNTGVLVPTPYMDSGVQTNLGQLSYTLNAGATVGTYSWQLGFSIAYMIPQLKPYSKERASDAPPAFTEYHGRHDHM